MRPILLTLAALVLPALFADTAEAQLFRRRQPDINIQVNNGVAGQQFRQQQVVRQRVVQQKVVQQRFVQQYAVPVRQQVVVRQQFVQPSYVQPVVVQQQGVCHGCNGGGLQLQQGCASLFAY